MIRTSKIWVFMFFFVFLVCTNNIDIKEYRCHLNVCVQNIHVYWNSTYIKYMLAVALIMESGNRLFIQLIEINEDVHSEQDAGKNAKLMINR